MNSPDSLTALSEELESVADKLRADAIDSDEAADLVERCAEIAARLGLESGAPRRGSARRSTHARAGPPSRRARSASFDSGDRGGRLPDRATGQGRRLSRG